MIVAPTPENVALAARLLREGELVGMPTETVYGLAAAVFDERALARVFEVKERPTFDPLIVHVDAPEPGRALETLEGLGLVATGELSTRAREMTEQLARAFWPGPLTLVLPKQARVPDLATAGLPSVGVRAPRHPVARALIKLAGPLAAPSANRFGRISPTTPAAVVEELGERVRIVLDGGPCEIGVESTVLSVNSSGELELLRPGGVPLDAIASATGAPVARLAVSARGQDARLSPGTLESHYAPRKRLVLLPMSMKQLRGDERQRLREIAASARTVGFLAFRVSNEAFAAIVERPVEERILSESGDLAEAARNLFAALRELDASPVDVIFAEPCPIETGLGHAIGDRLRRASAPRGSSL